MNAQKMKTSSVKMENSEELRTKHVTTVTARNPLGDICGNVMVNKIVTQTKVVKSSVQVTRNKRANSDSDTLVVKRKFTLNAEKVTERKVNTDDEVFISGSENLNFISTEETETNASGTSLDVKNNSSDSQAIVRKPAHKSKLLEKISKRSKPGDEDENYAKYLYDDEYFEDNLEYMLLKETEFVYRKDLLHKSINTKFRMQVVNWLNHTHQILCLSEQTYFIVIRMFDFIIASCSVPTKKYGLIGLTCMWITNKNSDVYFIKASRLSNLCQGTFSSSQIEATEREILKVLKFNVNFPEPQSFLSYFLKQQNLNTEPDIRYGALFVLETMTLSLNFSTLAPSLLAAMALYIVLRKFNLETDSFVAYIDKTLINADVFLPKSQQFETCLISLLRESPDNEIIKKYVSEKKGSVAKLLLIG